MWHQKRLHELFQLIRFFLGKDIQPLTISRALKLPFVKGGYLDTTILADKSLKLIQELDLLMTELVVLHELSKALVY